MREIKTRPILFSAPMVRAILDGHKTQTRRALKKQESYAHWSCATRVFDSEYLKQFLPGADQSSWVLQEHPGEIVDLKWQPVGCPNGKPGDRLWVRETFSANEFMECKYRADETVPCGWTPSIHMPRWASRITLEITNVRVERLQDISAADAKAEGCTKPHLPTEISGIAGDYTADERTSFALLWNSINGPGSWQQNPWVWVIEFKRIQEAA